MSILQLSKFTSIADLSEEMERIAKSDRVRFLIVNDEFVMITPGKQAREAIGKRIVEKLANCPSHLSDLMDRLEKETPEDWEA